MQSFHFLSSSRVGSDFRGPLRGAGVRRGTDLTRVGLNFSTWIKHNTLSTAKCRESAADECFTRRPGMYTKNPLAFYIGLCDRFNVQKTRSQTKQDIKGYLSYMLHALTTHYNGDWRVSRRQTQTFSFQNIFILIWILDPKDWLKNFTIFLFNVSKNPSLISFWCRYAALVIVT